jgi:hypothetical protein
MTPSVSMPSKHKPHEQRFYCDICGCEYGVPPLSRLEISESYGLAIFNDGAGGVIKVSNEIKEE